MFLVSHSLHSLIHNLSMYKMVWNEVLALSMQLCWLAMRVQVESTDSEAQNPRRWCLY